MSDHNAQLLMSSTVYSHIPIQKSKTVRKISKNTISDFINKLRNELWDTIFNSNDVSAMFNSFLNIYLRIFYCSLPPERVMNKNDNGNNNNWITLGIKTSCKHKRELYLACRNINNMELKGTTSYIVKFCLI